jgi:hypothetical protein
MLVCGAGVPNAFIQLSFEQLKQVSGGRVVDIVEQRHVGQPAETAAGQEILFYGTSEYQSLESHGNGLSGPPSLGETGQDERREVMPCMKRNMKLVSLDA